MKSVAAIRFLLELTAVGALVVAGAASSWIFAVLAPVALVVVWGGLVAPNARHRLRDPLRLGLEIMLFAALGYALALAGHAVYGVALATASAICALVIRTTGDPWADHAAQSRGPTG